MDANTPTPRLAWVDGPYGSSLTIGVIDMSVTQTAHGWQMCAKVGWTMIVDPQHNPGNKDDAKVYLMALVNRWLFNHVDTLIQATDVMLVA